MNIEKSVLKVRKLKSMLLSLCAMIILCPSLIISSSACTTAYFPWNWNNGTYYPIVLSVQMCSQDFHSKISLNDVIFVWNNISSNIRLTYSYSGETSGNPSNINLHSAQLTGSTIGITHIYGKNVAGQYIEISSIASSLPVAQARVELDTSLLNNSAQMNKTIVHEIGHCLALQHPIENGCTELAVMQQSSTQYSSLVITQHDKNNLIAKWGA